MVLEIICGIFRTQCQVHEGFGQEPGFLFRPEGQHYIRQKVENYGTLSTLFMVLDIFST